MSENDDVNWAPGGGQERPNFLTEKKLQPELQSDAMSKKQQNKNGTETGFG